MVGISTLNPVGAKLAQRPQDYRWSSYRAYLGERKDEGRISPFIYSSLTLFSSFIYSSLTLFSQCCNNCNQSDLNSGPTVRFAVTIARKSGE